MNLADLTADLRVADGKATVASDSASDSCDWAGDTEEVKACEVASDIDAQRKNARARSVDDADVVEGIEVK